MIFRNFNFRDDNIVDIKDKMFYVLEIHAYIFTKWYDTGFALKYSNKK